MTKFRAIVTSETVDGFVTEVKERDTAELPAGDVLINVCYSSLNYKDGLSASGNRGVTKKFPHTPGIDAAGIVAESGGGFEKGDEVIVTGYDLGMNTSGGFAEYVRVPAAWVVKKPAALSLREAMIYGTAGFTAALSVMKLQEGGVTPDKGAVLVTGASGGVGSVAVAMLAGLGYRVTAVSGKPEMTDFLKDLGASEVIGRSDATDTGARPLLKAEYAGAVDTVGGGILATVLKKIAYGGVVTTCGLTMSHELNTTVFPFILRGVSLMGVDSVELPIQEKRAVWERIAGDLRVRNIESLASQTSLGELPQYLKMILEGKTTGRLVVKI
jgi:putative YhdH/YhfP family quinone oxidoreductase